MASPRVTKRCPSTKWSPRRMAFTNIGVICYCSAYSAHDWKQCIIDRHRYNNKFAKAIAELIYRSVLPIHTLFLAKLHKHPHGSYPCEADVEFGSHELPSVGLLPYMVTDGIGWAQWWNVPQYQKSMCLWKMFPNNTHVCCCKSNLHSLNVPSSTLFIICYHISCFTLRNDQNLVHFFLWINYQTFIWTLSEYCIKYMRISQNFTLKLICIFWFW